MTQQSVEYSPSVWFGQPRGLTILFMTEMWEKFSFYGMRALLVYYMTRQLHLQQAGASYIYGLYTGFLYFTPIIGGLLSDRWLGRRRSILLGGSIMAAGHFMMASQALFYPALATIVVGNGLYLPSLPSQIGALYRADDPRRASAYNIYYVGVNLGAFMAPLVCGTLGEIYGWHWGFAAAGVGMVAGLLIYVAGTRYLPPDIEPTPTRLCGPITHAPGGVVRSFVLLGGVAAVVVIFRAAYEQMGNTVALWAADGVDRAVGSAFIPMTWFQSLNPLLVFILTPLLLGRWRRRAQQGLDSSSIRKMSIGAATVAAAYLLIAVGALCAQSQGTPASWIWLVAYFVVATAGELYILPVGLGLFGRLAPAHLAATTIAAWFLAAFVGNVFAGILGSLWSRFDHAMYFALIAAVALVASICFLMFDKAVQRAEQAQDVTNSSAAFAAVHRRRAPMPTTEHPKTSITDLYGTRP